MDPHDFESAVADSLRSLGIRGRVLIAVSGGADSVALLRAMATIRTGNELDITAAHLNHQLRGDESTADANLVRQLCLSLGIQLVEQRIDIRRIAEEHGTGIEETARNARYEFLTTTAVELRCPWVLVAHTADDQVETVLHHVLRGTGLAGLRGMPRTRELAQSITLARPLLDLGRAWIASYLRSIEQAWRDDATNRDTRLTRNRIRHDLLPMLRERFNPHIEAAILQLARQSSEVQDLIDAIADKRLTECRLEASPDTLRLETTRLADQPLHLVREVLKRSWRSQDWPVGGMGFDHWTSVALMAQGQHAAVDLPGRVHAERRGTLLVLTRRTAD